MNKTAIKNFAVWARNKLIADISYRAGLMGITKSGIASALPQSTGTTEFYDIGTAEPYAISGDEVRQRKRLVELIERKAKETDYETAYKYIIEEVAYTWFNRLIAIRFMEVNDYLPSHIRVLSSESGKMEPDIVTSPFEADLELSAEEEQLVINLKQRNDLDELFKILLIKQCNVLNGILPELFEKTYDYTELLLNISFVDREGVVWHLLNDIDEEDFNVEKEGQVEIIGWLYQYYNIEPKDEAFALLKKNVKITKERIPAATQLFTPDWIVRYMVENSLGRLWVEGHPNDGLKENWKYYLEEAEQEESVQVQLEQLRAEYGSLNPEDIKVIDPCMGSGHILVYCFDVLMQIYESQGYTQRDAAQSILENNLFGLDIDKRATQLAYFAVMMKARQYDRRIFARGIKPHVYAIEESNGINRGQLKYFGTHLSSVESSKAKREITAVIDTFVDAKEYGSILNVEKYDWDLLHHYVDDLDDSGQMSLDSIGIDKSQELLRVLIMQGQVMAQKYEVVVTNPPYMGASGMSSNLAKYVKDNYPESKTDLFSVFIEKCGLMTVKSGYQAMITQHAWMFLGSFEKLRRKLLHIDTISMAHLGARAFEEIGGEVVQTTSFVFRKSNVHNHKGVYYRLVEPTTQQGKEKMFLAGEGRYESKQEDFEKIPGLPYAYWASRIVLDSFNDERSAKNYADFRHGMSTSDNNRFLRLWFEVDNENIGFDALSKDDTFEKKWYIYLKGGSFRRWYGNYDYIVNWKEDGREIKEISNIKYPYLKGNLDFVLGGQMYFFKPGYTWSSLTSGHLGIRKFNTGCLFDAKGQCYFPNDEVIGDVLLGFYNSKVFDVYGKILAPTLDYNSGVISKAPILLKNEAIDFIRETVNDNVKLSQEDWDSFETSWDFLTHPLVLATEVPDMNGGHKAPLSDCYEKWEALSDKRFNQLKVNEEALNRIFIEIYGLQDELTPEVEDKDVTVRKADLQRDIKSLLSYAVGCMFGRYSLDEPGLAYAGGDWDAGKYSTFIPDEDNCIPVTDEEYFEDDIVGQFVGWMKKAFGEETLEENLDFIANALGNKGKTSREVIRNYFLNNFIKDHIKMYQKRPIYWMFDSGKQNGFKALVYMHRYDANTIGNMRIDYLHRMQRVYESEINRMQDSVDNSANAREVAVATKRKEKLQKQIKECREYDEKIGHLALSRIDIDLDDGVKVNYEKVQTASDGKKYQVLAKI